MGKNIIEKFLEKYCRTEKAKQLLLRLIKIVVMDNGFRKDQLRNPDGTWAEEGEAESGGKGKENKSNKKTAPKKTPEVEKEEKEETPQIEGKNEKEETPQKDIDKEARKKKMLEEKKKWEDPKYIPTADEMKEAMNRKFEDIEFGSEAKFARHFIEHGKLTYWKDGEKHQVKSKEEYLKFGQYIMNMEIDNDKPKDKRKTIGYIQIYNEDGEREPAIFRYNKPSNIMVVATPWGEIKTIYNAEPRPGIIETPWQKIKKRAISTKKGHWQRHGIKLNFFI